ncbi:hypothetical protein C8R42DRAFT_666566 [Lentinula raphanica]|nr:hypothetical protein C8R42DRAFT_666566 [Lentinula raphanica]
MPIDFYVRRTLLDVEPSRKVKDRILDPQEYPCFPLIFRAHQVDRHSRSHSDRGDFGLWRHIPPGYCYLPLVSSEQSDEEMSVRELVMAEGAFQILARVRKWQEEGKIKFKEAADHGVAKDIRISPGMTDG